jgi:hypothetical protein
LPEKSVDFEGDCRTIRTGFEGIAAEMRKPKKNTKTRKKALDTSPRKKAQSGRGGAQSRQFAPSVFGTDELDDLAGWSPSWPLELAIPEETKKGRPTIPDDFLLGDRNSWLHFLEEAWPEIGWSLMNIRRDRSTTIEDIQKVFETVQSKDNFHHGRTFLSGLPELVEGDELRRNRIRSADLLFEIQTIRTQIPELRRSCEEAEEALKNVGEEERQIIEKELGDRRKRLVRLEETLGELETESKELTKMVPGQETYYYCSELLKFLHKRDNKVAPLNLANALAGLPHMGSRESFDRCHGMPRCFPERLPYQVFKVVSRICGRIRKDLKDTPTEFFRIQIMKLPRKDDGLRETLHRVWRDLRLAVVECWSQHNQDFMPYAITLAFLRNHRSPKTAAERILDQQGTLQYAPLSTLSKSPTKRVK